MTNPARRFDAVIFDFDGLMVDTESPAFEAWSEIYREHGVELSLVKWVECVGSTYASFDPVAHLSELTGRPFDRAALVADKEQRKADICAQLPLLPGARERLEEARALGLRTAIASSSPAFWVHGHAERLGFTSLLDALRTRDDVARVKPHPDVYLSAAAGLGVAPERCLVFEDSLNGVRAAKAAGMCCFAVPNRITQALDFTSADGVFPSLTVVSLAALTSP